MFSDAKARKVKPNDKPVSDGTRSDDRRDRDQETARLAAVPTFEKVARLHHADRIEGFRNRKHIDQWINTLDQYVFPEIGKKLVNALGPADFAACLKPIWLSKPETSSRIKQRCDTVMNWAAAHGYIVASPVRVVDKLLPKQPGKRERVAHQPALPWRDLPTFFSGVPHAGPPNATRQMLELLILTACRSGELRQMQWDEIDFSSAIWTVPAARMKAKFIHRVPLSQKSIQILVGRLEKSETGEGLVFPSRKSTPISDMTLTKFLRDNEVLSDTPGRIATAHGFRSSFRDWASENGYPRDVAERALAHAVKNAVEAAYHRTDLIDQRRAMMSAWEAFCLGK
ncbi:integrase [Rhizobium leguminosarum]|nr:integrase [Rhizobium leguminosarum]TAV40676.1 integrase [Rhizobium leguminosarum]